MLLNNQWVKEEKKNTLRQLKTEMKHNISKCMEFVCKTFHPNAEEYTFLSSAYGIFSRIDHILGHKPRVGKFKKTEIISNIFSDINIMRLDINYRKKKKNVKITNT